MKIFNLILSFTLVLITKSSTVNWIEIFQGYMGQYCNYLGMITVNSEYFIQMTNFGAYYSSFYTAISNMSSHQSSSTINAGDPVQALTANGCFYGTQNITCDGINWNPMTTVQISVVAYGNGLYLASDGSNAMYSSSDGINFDFLMNCSQKILQITFNGEFFHLTSTSKVIFAKYQNGVLSDLNVPLPSNLVIKNNVNDDYFVGGNGLIYGNGIYLGLSTSNTIITSSAIDLEFTEGTQLNISLSFMSFCDGYFVLTYGPGSTIYYSADGVNWGTLVCNQSVILIGNEGNIFYGYGYVPFRNILTIYEAYIDFPPIVSSGSGSGWIVFFVIFILTGVGIYLWVKFKKQVNLIT